MRKARHLMAYGLLAGLALALSAGSVKPADLRWDITATHSTQTEAVTKTLRPQALLDMRWD